MVCFLSVIKSVLKPIVWSVKNFVKYGLNLDSNPRPWDPFSKTIPLDNSSFYYS